MGHRLVIATPVTPDYRNTDNPSHTGYNHPTPTTRQPNGSSWRDGSEDFWTMYLWTGACLVGTDYPYLPQTLEATVHIVA